MEDNYKSLDARTRLQVEMLGEIRLQELLNLKKDNCSDELKELGDVLKGENLEGESKLIQKLNAA
ncbi:hypothetical protein FJZ31_34130 [Candidatus Poribacteria bacterium]|nr:hypothetical protein [Candidatus Poribacteria bacterium]